MNFLFLLVQILWPLCHYGSGLFNLEFHLYNETVYWLVSAAISVLIWKADKKSKGYWNVLLFPVTVLSCVWELIFSRSLLGVPCAIVRTVCAYLFLNPMPDRWPKYLAKGINVFLILAFLAFCGFDLTFGSIGRTTIVEEAPAPDGTCTALLIDDDQGALGGNTFVRVIWPDRFTVGIGGFRTKTKTIYRGSWGEFQEIDLEWSNDYTVLIHGKPYLAGDLEAEYRMVEPLYLTSEDRVGPYRCRFTEDSLELRQDITSDFESIGNPEPYPLTNRELSDYTAADRCWVGPSIYSRITDAYIVRMEEDYFYLFFRTANGKTYLGYGWEDMGERGEGASDDTGLYLLCEMESTYQ